MRPLSRSLAAFTITLLLGSFVSAPAQASPATLRRAFSNVLNAPLDMALSPFSGGLALANNLNDIEDSPGVRLVYALPGFVWLTGLNLGSGAIRLVTGGLELVPGVALFAFEEQDMDPLFDAVENASGMLEYDNPLADVESAWVQYNPLLTPFTIPIKGGINYSRVEY